MRTTGQGADPCYTPVVRVVDRQLGGKDRYGHRSWWVDIAVIISGAAAIRLLFFHGLVLGDDQAYAGLVRQIIDNGYPEIGRGQPFLVRPVWMLLVAGSVKAFGWNVFAFVLPVLVSSLMCIGSVYVAGRLLGGRLAGIVASLTLSVFPLDVVNATTLTNDIVASAFVGCAMAVLAFVFVADLPTRVSFLSGIAGGFLIGLAVGVKLNIVICGLPLIATYIWFSTRRNTLEVSALAPILGWAASLVSLALFFLFVTKTGPLAPFHVEMAFNNAHFKDVPSLVGLGDVLLYYPRRMIGLNVSGMPGWQYSEYGHFFVICGFAFIAAVISGIRRAVYFGLWAIALFLAMELWPLQIIPNYIPIHRLPRFLHFIAIPGTMLVGLTASALVGKGKVGKAGVAFVLSLYAVLSIHEVRRISFFYRDSISDLKVAWGYARRFDGPVFGDENLRQYLQMRDRFANPRKFRPLGALDEVADGAMVVLGGSRQPALNPSIAASMIPTRIPGNLVPIGEVSSGLRPWRLKEMAVYLSVPLVESTRLETAVRPTYPTNSRRLPQCGGGNWILVDEIDIGDGVSERGHDFETQGETWHGDQSLLNQDGTLEADNGRAFVGFQGFAISGIRPGIPLCIEKRIDGRVLGQKTRWHVSGLLVGTMNSPISNSSSGWLDLFLTVAADHVQSSRLVLREDFLNSEGDANSFSVRFYQPDDIGVAVTDESAR